MLAQSTEKLRQLPGRGLVLLGLATAIAAILGYVLQLWAKRMVTPWYMPILGTLAVAAVGAALWRARTFWRVLALVFVLLLAGMEWTFLLMLRVPPYTGLVAAGKPLPAFSTVTAGGAVFARENLLGEQNSLFVFFRGRW